MKKIVTFLIFVNFGISFSQNINCLDFKYYSAGNDVKLIKNSTDSINDVLKLETKTDSLILAVFPNSEIEFPKYSSLRRKGINNGFKIILKNNSSNDISLNNFGGNIIITRQVYHNKKWIPVKSYDRTKYPICGNSYLIKRTVIIKSNNYFTFIAPCINGELSVKYRFAINVNSENGKSVIYSNEFDGFINESLIE